MTEAVCRSAQPIVEHRAANIAQRGDQHQQPSLMLAGQQQGGEHDFGLRRQNRAGQKGAGEQAGQRGSTGGPHR